MTQITFPVVFYLGKYPTTSAPPPTTGPTDIFASIQCMGPDSEVLELIYLRPDATQWCDDYGRVCEWQSNSYDIASKHGVAYFNAHKFASHYALLTSRRAVQVQVDDAYPGGNRIFADVTMSEPSQEAVPDVIAWLNQHMNIYDALKWNEPSAMGLHYADWSSQKQQEFRQAFAAAWNHQPMTFDDPPPNLADYNNGGWTVLDADHAWQLFCAHAAYGLAVEIASRVPWSIIGYNAANLSLLFNGGNLFRYNPARNGYELMISAVPAPPEFTWSFLSSNDLIGADRLSTIARVLDWCRNHLQHYSSGSTLAGDMLAHWGYAGNPPVSRVVQGTISSMEPRLGIRHYTAGCWGTTAFLQAVLRTANIPVEAVWCSSSHTTPHFVTDDRYLSHGDDPYDAHSGCTSPYDAGCLLIEGATFNSWFGPGVSSTTKENNVGRQGAILAVENLPDILLHLYYRENLDGRSPQNGYVYPVLQRYYPNIHDLYPDLWQRLEQKLSGFGYPDKVFFPWPSDLPRIYCDPFFRLLPPRLISALGRWFHFSDNITHG